MSFYRRINESRSDFLERNQLCALYTICFSTVFTFILMLILAIVIIPISNDASILLNDGSKTLHDFGILVPSVQKMMPEARNSTIILGRMIPEINQGLRILRQLCKQTSSCYL